jgi:eukaryotic-like serine/threonine-protein kinase
MADALQLPADPMIGRTLVGRYELKSHLGSGTMGTVYRATQLAVGREVAVKILKNERAVDEAANARFTREARANSLLTSPHTVQVLDFGYGDTDGLFLVMELLEGESLRRRLGRLGRLPPAIAIDTCQQALRSLIEAHAKGIIHRDLKPEHLFFARVRGETWDDEILKILDFGVAKMIGEEGRRLNAIETREGRILGTPRYMSPEQAQGGVLDARSDLYSLGVVLYEMLTGRPPFGGDDAVVVMAQHITKAPVAPAAACPEAGIPPELDDLVMRTLSKDPEGRPASAEVLAEQLTLILASGRAGSTGVRSVRRGGPSLPPPPADSGAVPTKEIGTEPDTVATAVVRWRRTSVLLAAAIGFSLVVGVVLLFERSRAATVPTPIAAGSTTVAAPPSITPPAPRTSVAAASATASAIPVEALPPVTTPSTPATRRPRPGSVPAPRDSARPALPRPKPTGPDFDYLE